LVAKGSRLPGDCPQAPASTKVDTNMSVRLRRGIGDIFTLVGVGSSAKIGLGVDTLFDRP
jgi:hypothetical protein